MANAIDRTTLAIRQRVNRHNPPYNGAGWLLLGSDIATELAIAQQYRKIVAEAVVEMDSAEKAVVDAASATAAQDAEAAALVDKLEKPTVLGDTAWSTSTSGLTVTINVGTLLVGDQETVTADATEVTYVRASLVYNEGNGPGAGAFTSLVDTRTDSTLYGDLAAGEEAFTLAEWTLVANGTVLVEAT